MVDCGKRFFFYYIYKISVNRILIKSFEFKVCNLLYIYFVNIKYSLYEYRYIKFVLFLLYVSFMIYVYVIGILFIKKNLKEIIGYV